MSRVDCVKLAVKKARDDLEGAVLASDAFFPFADGRAGHRKPASRRSSSPAAPSDDSEVVKACDDAGIAMVFTGRRHFRH